MFGLLADQGIASIPWSPLAKGRLARPYGEA
jgi:aryl-alcohol dehydrogenase-like predicted oxidoreductase